MALTSFRKVFTFEWFFCFFQGTERENEKLLAFSVGPWRVFDSHQPSSRLIGWPILGDLLSIFIFEEQHFEAPHYHHFTECVERFVDRLRVRTLRLCRQAVDEFVRPQHDLQLSRLSWLQKHFQRIFWHLLFVSNSHDHWTQQLHRLSIASTR